MSEVKDTLRKSIATLLGKKTQELPSFAGSEYISLWKSHLRSVGVKVETLGPRENSDEEHIVLYSDINGATQAMLSSDELASSVKPLARLVLTKKPSKAADKES